MIQEKNGLNNPTNWQGVVEDYDDPLKTGRLRVRIFGFHNLDKKILPTDCLPWALIATPVSGIRTSSAPLIGDYVVGFFLDGSDAQFPVVTGLIGSLNQSTLVAQPADAPKPPAVDGPIAGAPITPAGAYVVDKTTSIFHINKNLIHACDISYEVDQACGAVRNYFSTIIQKIRVAINLIIKSLNFDSTGQAKKIAETIRGVVRIIKKINNVLKEIKNAIKVILIIARKVKAMIDYILSLPAKWLAFFKECLSRLYKILAAGILSLFPDFGGGGGSDFADIGAAVKEGVEAVSETISLVADIISSPAQLMAVLIAPTSGSEQAEAAATLAEYVSDSDNLSSGVGDTTNEYGEPITSTGAASLATTAIEDAKNSISSGVDAVTQATKDAADRVKEYVLGLSTNSQSTVNPGSGKGWA
jgi:hypothetical protein